MRLKFRKRLERYCKRSFKHLVKTPFVGEDNIPVESLKEGFKDVVRDMGYDLIAELRVTENDIKILNRIIEGLK